MEFRMEEGEEVTVATEKVKDINVDPVSLLIKV